MTSMNKDAFRSVVFGFGAVAFAACSVSAAAQDFYHGKQITMIVGAPVGGGYDTYARLLVRHWPGHIPGQPSIIVQNMPAAGSLVAMNTLANISPKDGTTIGAVQNHIGVEPLMGLTGAQENIKYDARQANWIGSTTKEVPVVALWHTVPFKSFQDLIGHEAVVASSGVATSDSVYARVMNTLVGTKFKVVEGYKGNPEMATAMEQGEVMGRAGWFVSSLMSTKGQLVADKQIRVFVQVALEKHPDFPDVPLVTEFTKSADSREQLEFALSFLLMGRPYVAPPGVPADRVKLLRDSFMQTLASPEFLQEAKRVNLDISPMTGEEIHALLDRQYKTSPALVEKVRAMMAAAGK